jgi:hypothetical protein
MISLLYPSWFDDVSSTVSEAVVAVAAQAAGNQLRNVIGCRETAKGSGLSSAGGMSLPLPGFDRGL